MAQRNKTHEARIRELEKILMGGNPGAPSSGGVPLRDHFESRITSLEKATMLAANTLEKRLEGMNEFRETLRDQATRFVTREEMDLRVGRNREAIEELRTFKDRLEGKASAQSVWIAYGFTLVSFVLAVIGLLR